MPLTVSQGEGMTVITVTPNTKSKWPVLCQRLLCCSPVCSVSQDMKGKLKNSHIAFGIVQMIFGILNIVVGIVMTCLGLYWNMDRMAMGPFWLGIVFLVAGIVCVLAAKFPSSSLLVIGMIVNVVSAALAVTAVVLYSVDHGNNHTRYIYNDPCDQSKYFYSRYDYDRYRLPSPEEVMRMETCLYYKNLTEVVFSGLDIIMIALSVLQLCVTISFCVLTGKALCKKDEDAKDPELYKQILEDDTAVPAC